MAERWCRFSESSLSTKLPFVCKKISCYLLSLERACTLVSRVVHRDIRDFAFSIPLSMIDGTSMLSMILRFPLTFIYVDVSPTLESAQQEGAAYMIQKKQLPTKLSTSSPLFRLNISALCPTCASRDLAGTTRPRHR